MSRPQKEGIDYFSLDCQFNDKVKLIQAEFGPVGIGILIKLWQKIYGEKGYYTAWDNDVALVFAQDCKAGANVVKEVVSACLRRGIFDTEKFEQYNILTSEGVQERYAEATERRTVQKIDGRYLLITMPDNWICVNNNMVNVNNNNENADDNPQSKVNNSKSKLNYFNTTTTTARVRDDIPSDQEILEYFVSRKFDDPETEAYKFKVYNESRGWDCLPNWKGAANLWRVRMEEHKNQ